MDILVGLLFLLLGLAVATMGLRIWFWMLPVLGFLAGFSLGAILVHQLAGDGLFQTVLGWVVGLVAGIAFALISWFWWYFGVIIAAGSAGAGVATALAATVGAERDWVIFIVAAIGAALAVLAALVLNLPIYLVIVNTAIAGALGAVAGLLLILDQIDLNLLGRGHAVALIEDTPVWWILWLVVAAAGIYLQLRETAAVALPEQRFVPASHAIRR